MKSIEENALVAMRYDEDADAEILIVQLLPGERARLAKAAPASLNCAKPIN